jgi:hypothetical protein
MSKTYLKSDHFNGGGSLRGNVIQDLLIGIVALAIAAGLLVIALPNRYGESPRFLQFYAAPMVYPAVVLVFLGLGFAELISWAATWW